MTIHAPDLDEATFRDATEPWRREILAHCYRMSGSPHDAEDLVQETYLRAWRAFDRFEERSSVRTWLHRIATNTCLTALAGRARRPLPTGLGGPPGDPTASLVVRDDLRWVEPMPDALLWAHAPADPAEDAVARDDVRLAFVAALQHLTAQQRAVLLLRDVLCWQATEVATALDLSVGAVTSTLQRARAHLTVIQQRDAAAREGRGAGDGEPRDGGRPAALPDAHAERLLEDYVAAFERYDVDRIVELCTRDVIWEMPPYEEWYAGAGDVGRLIRTHCPAGAEGDMRLVRTAANGAPAIAVYLRGEDGVHRPFQLQHLVLGADGVRHVTVWFDDVVFASFGLPAVLADAEAAPAVDA